MSVTQFWEIIYKKVPSKYVDLGWLFRLDLRLRMRFQSVLKGSWIFSGFFRTLLALLAHIVGCRLGHFNRVWLSGFFQTNQSRVVCILPTSKIKIHEQGRRI